MTQLIFTAIFMQFYIHTFLRDNKTNEKSHASSQWVKNFFFHCWRYIHLWWFPCWLPITHKRKIIICMLQKWEEYVPFLLYIITNVHKYCHDTRSYIIFGDMPSLYIKFYKIAWYKLCTRYENRIRWTRSYIIKAY